MFRLTHVCRCLAAFCGGCMVIVAIGWSAELESPFLPAAAPSAAGPAAMDPLPAFELSGIITAEGETRVCLVDAQTNRGRWLKVGVVEDGLLAERYDAERGAVLLRSGPQARWLDLRRGVGQALPVARLQDGSVDWFHMKLSTRDKEIEAMHLMQDIMNVSAQARAGTLTTDAGASLSRATSY